MNWFLWLLIGIVVGWLIEFVIDYLFWQRRCSELGIELNRVQARTGDLEARALSSEREVQQSTSKLNDLQRTLDKAYGDLTGAHTIQETLRKNVQVLEDRVDNWGRKIGLLTSADGLLGSLGAAFSRDEDDDLQQRIEAIHLKLNDTSASVTESKRDPLHEINGIGAVYEQRLNDAGIFTFAGLIAAGSQRIHEIISPKDWQAIDTKDWLAQAQAMLNKERAK